MRGDGRVYQRGRIWWVEYWHRGTPVRESSRSRDRKVAERLLRERRRTAGTPHFVGPQAERVTFEDLAAAYLRDYRLNNRRTLAHAARHVRQLATVFGGARALDLTAARIAAYAEARRAAGSQPASVNRELAALRRMFTLAVRTGVLPSRPHIALLDDSENVREGFLEPAAFAALCAHLPPHLQDVAQFAYLTGWRIGAIRGLEWRDVDLAAGTLRLRKAHAKNKRGQVLPLGDALRALLARRAAARDLRCPFVFPGPRGQRLGDFRRAWRRACTAAGLGGVLFHDLRRSFARNAVRAGIPEPVVMALGGWRSRSVFDRYNITAARDLATAQERLTTYLDRAAAAPPTVRPLHEPAQNPHSLPAAGRAGLGITQVSPRSS